eukprot:gnl/MRDRNA2_/MRDRNA2_78995_c0_seq2.p1 gnl/MRDRNA2_/MRDRNA2_78995_c0~~gnl/MRDRNA2_/MRDRNA2_78995_c0_seq2.p1  ORF type:complete len:788 (+),score=107.37 gnl/MRDRNA2_/MRDRNA2_78995_c0_seq2:295-2364(+)
MQADQEEVRQYPFYGNAEMHFEIHRHDTFGFLYWQSQNGHIFGLRFPSSEDELRFEHGFNIAKERNSAAISRIEAVQLLGQQQRRGRWQCDTCLLFWPKALSVCSICTHSHELQTPHPSTPENDKQKQRVAHQERLSSNIPLKRRRLRVINSEGQAEGKSAPKNQGKENCQASCNGKSKTQHSSRDEAERAPFCTAPVSSRNEFSEAQQDKARAEDEDTRHQGSSYAPLKYANITKSRGSKCGASSDMTGWLLARLPMLASEDPHAQLMALRQIVAVLTRRGDSVWHAIAGGIPRFIELAGPRSHQAVQREAASLLAQLAAGSAAHADVVAGKGAAIPLSCLLSSDADSVRATALRALHRISEGSLPARLSVLQAPGMVPALEALSNVCGRQPAELRRAAALLMSLCEGLSSSETDMARCLLRAIQSMIQLDEPEVLVFTCWALTHLMESPHFCIASGWELTHLTWRRVVTLLSHNVSRVQVPSLRAVGQLLYACIDAQAVSAILDDLGAVAALAGLLHHEERCLRMDACWALSNVASDILRARQVVDCPGLLVQVAWMLAQDDWAVRAEAVWVVLRLAEHRNADIVEQLLEMDCVTPLAQLLRSPDGDVIVVEVCSLYLDVHCPQVVLHDEVVLHRLRWTQEVTARLWVMMKSLRLIPMRSSLEVTKLSKTCTSDSHGGICHNSLNVG